MASDIEAMEMEPFLLLSKNEKVLQPDLSNNAPERAGSWKQGFYVNLFFAVIYATITFVIFHNRSGLGQPANSSAVLQLPIKSDPQLYDNLNHNPFVGPPTPQVDAAWHDLMGNIHVRVSKEELERTKQTSVELPEGGGSLAWLGVYHELHCLKIIRRWTYQDHYYPDLTPRERYHWEVHSDHCIEYLRQAAMCHGDTSLTVFQWNETKTKPMLESKRSPHMCVDWSAIEAFSADRAVSSGEFARLENPLRQPSPSS